MVRVKQNSGLPPPNTTPASVVGIAATVPQVRLLLRSLKYSGHGIVTLSVDALAAELVDAAEDEACRLAAPEGSGRRTAWRAIADARSIVEGVLRVGMLALNVDVSAKS